MEELVEVDIKTLTINPTLASLFPTDPKVRESITMSMRIYGYDRALPIVVWNTQNIVVDGHTRLAAATAAGLAKVWVCHKSFADEGRALSYAIGNQRDRRNVTDREIFHAVVIADKRHSHGGDRKNDGGQSEAQDCALKKSAEKTARVVGISPRKVEQIRTVLDHGAPETVAAVKAGDRTINSAYRETQKRRRASTDARRTPKRSPRLLTPIIHDLGKVRSRLARVCKSGAQSHVKAPAVLKEIASCREIVREMTEALDRIEGVVKERAESISVENDECASTTLPTSA